MRLLNMSQWFRASSCPHLDEVLDAIGYSAMRGHGGGIARVLSGGVIRVGEAVV